MNSLLFMLHDRTIADDRVMWSVASVILCACVSVCLSVCLWVCSLKRKCLELSTPNFVFIFEQKFVRTNTASAVTVTCYYTWHAVVPIRPMWNMTSSQNGKYIHITTTPVNWHKNWRSLAVHFLRYRYAHGPTTDRQTNQTNRQTDIFTTSQYLIIYYTTTTVLPPSLILSGTTRVSWHQKRKIRKVKAIWTY